MDSVNPSKIIDTKFVMAAVAIGAAYAVIVAQIGAVLGKEPAAVAAVALGALATAIFRQFETLRFRKVVESEHLDIPVPKIAWWRVVVAASSLFGQQMALFAVAAVLTTWILPFGIWVIDAPDWITEMIFIVLGMTFGLFGGFMIAKAFPVRAYSSLAIAALIACVVTDVVIFAMYAPLTEVSREEVFDSWTYAFWLFNVLTVLLGAKFAVRAQPNSA